VSVIYLIALIAVAVILVCALCEAVVAVGRKPRWGVAQRLSLSLVDIPERRVQDLPFAGRERRKDRIAAHAAAELARQAA
jgi:uncharacterized membrane protein